MRRPPKGKESALMVGGLTGNPSPFWDISVRRRVTCDALMSVVGVTGAERVSLSASQLWLSSVSDGLFYAFACYLGLGAPVL